jgi:oligopeptide/dipeptide ABC transporter ATP-binding protein
MYLGRIVECAGAADLYRDPRHPYTAALLASVPRPDPRATRAAYVLEGSVPDPSNIPPGCAFAERCRYAVERCRVERPELLTPDGGTHAAACHRAGEIDLAADVPRGDIGWLPRAAEGGPR